MKKALYTATAIAVLSLSTLAALAQPGAHPNDLLLGNPPLPRQSVFLSGNTMLSILMNFVF
jgi:hypothetical protein